MKYEFIELHRKSYPVSALCLAVQVARSAYYAARDRPSSARSLRQSSLITQIRQIHLASRATYGAPRVHAELVAKGTVCSLNTVAKLMHQEGILPRSIRRFRVTTDSRRTQAAPHLVQRVFEAERPNVCWLSDITYIPTKEGWLYLAAILDMYSRAIVGWGMSRTLDGRLAIDALMMAINQRGTGPEILHSDQGSTYATADYRAILAHYQIKQSMSRKGNCWDNAPMESFFHTLKADLVMHCDYKTRDEARASLFDYLEVFYNRQRRHSTIHYEAPLVYEALTKRPIKVSTVRG